MNPWSRYEHQPELFEACIVGVAATVALVRKGVKGSGPSSWIALACLGWGALGALDFLV